MLQLLINNGEFMVHRDNLGREIKINDYVVVANSNKLQVCKVTAMALDFIITHNRQGSRFIKEPDEVIVLDSKYLTLQLMREQL